MAIKNQALTINFLVWNTDNNSGRTGDGSNITLYVIKDGGSATSATNSISEPTSAFMPGIYEVELNSTEMNANFITVGGKSSTSATAVFPVFIQTEAGNLSAINNNILSTSGNIVTIDTIVDTININTSGTNTLINGLNDISTTDVLTQVRTALSADEIGRAHV